MKYLLIGENLNLFSKIIYLKKGNVVPLSKIKFSNGQFIYKIPKLNDNENINIVCDVTNNIHESLWGLIFCLDFLYSNKIKIDKLIFPYFPYCRTNNASNNTTNNLFSIITLLNNYSIDKIITFDPHFGDQKFNIKAKFCYYSHYDIFNKNIKKFITNSSILIGPDDGSITRLKTYKDNFNCPIMTFKKQRRSDDEKVSYNVNKDDIKRLSKYNSAIIIDDEICSGNTLLKLIEIVKMANLNIKIYIFITHSFMRDYNKIIKDNNVNSIIITNSINSSLNHFNKIYKIDLSEKILV